MKITKDQISNKEPINIWIRCYDEKKFEAPHLLRANKIEFINDHLMFYLKTELIFKMWLKEDKCQKYKDINEALEDVGILL